MGQEPEHQERGFSFPYGKVARLLLYTVGFFLCIIIIFILANLLFGRSYDEIWR